ncbi:hypothetical protein [Aeromicrobium sp. 179-A 4D2 NHS]|uniref:hypothetical protein n=1 Tax=Aeromicrobium sp. 179-A 4D2 NHS TaxID=3142375 RepID=UPI0039A351A6
MHGDTRGSLFDNLLRLDDEFVRSTIENLPYDTIDPDADLVEEIDRLIMGEFADTPTVALIIADYTRDMWKAFDYDLDADPLSSTAREMRPEFTVRTIRFLRAIFIRDRDER